MKYKECYRLFDQVPEPIWVVNGDDATFVDANKASIEQYGYTKEEFLKLKISDIDDILNDEAKVGERTCEIRKKGEMTFETRHRTKDGRILNVLITASSFPIKERSLFSIVCRDITDTKRIKKELETSHKKFMTLFNQMPEAAWVVDVNTTAFLDVNEASIKQYGYTKEELLKLHISDIDIYDDADAVKERSQQIKRDGYAKFETKHRTKDGKILNVIVSVRLFFIDDRPVFSTTCHDITETKKKEKQLEKLNRQLEKRVAEELNKHIRQQDIIIQQAKLAAVGELLSNIAHQWRQPLNIVSLGIQNISTILHSESHDLEKIDNSINKMLLKLADLSDVINRFSNFFVSNDKRELFSINRIISDTVSLLKVRLDEYNIIFKIEGPQLYLEGFSNDFKQIIMSLLSNAIEAIGKKAKKEADNLFSGNILITTSEENNKKTVTITDNGEGIEKIIIEKLFDPYFTTKFQSFGVGISLYMSKMIIERNFGGTLFLDTEQNDKTSFVIEFY